MISASALVGTFPRARGVDAAMAPAAVSHAAVPRADRYVTPSLPDLLQPAAWLEPLLWVLAASGASLMLATALTGLVS